MTGQDYYVVSSSRGAWHLFSLLLWLLFPNNNRERLPIPSNGSLTVCAQVVATTDVFS